MIARPEPRRAASGAIVRPPAEDPGIAGWRGRSASEAVDRIRAWDDPALFLHLVAAPQGGSRGALAGVPLAVKDNIDVADLPTTAGHPRFRHLAEEDAQAVARLRAAGMAVVGKTNLDQFATGLVGTRSPFGTPRNPRRGDRIPGGSSSGSAAAVAAGLVPVALGTDTAGSGRVPAAFTGIVGFKPTRGWISTRGVVPACRSLDCVSVFAHTVADAWTVANAASGGDDATLRAPGEPAPLPLSCRIGMPDPAVLAPLDPAWRAGWERAAAALEALGHRIVRIAWEPFGQAADLLYGGPWVAERTAAVGRWLDDPDGADPTVRGIIRAGTRMDAVAAWRGLHRLSELRAQAERQWQAMDALLLPTAPMHPAAAEVAADPVAVNSRLGRFTNFANLLDTCAMAVPSGPDPTGVTIFAPAWRDPLVAHLGAALQDALSLPSGATGWVPPAQRLAVDDGCQDLAVFGAHMQGLPLEAQLRACGAIYRGGLATAPAYRCHVLPGDPPRPALVRGGDGVFAGERWRLPPGGLGRLLARIPPPLGLGQVQLDDGSRIIGFLAEAAGVVGCEEITRFGSWRAWLGR